jgi:hypothetical protein
MSRCTTQGVHNLNPSIASELEGRGERGGCTCPGDFLWSKARAAIAAGLIEPRQSEERAEDEGDALGLYFDRFRGVGQALIASRTRAWGREPLPRHRFLSELGFHRQDAGCPQRDQEKEPRYHHLTLRLQETIINAWPALQPLRDKLDAEKWWLYQKGGAGAKVDSGFGNAFKSIWSPVQRSSIWGRLDAYCFRKSANPLWRRCVASWRESRWGVVILIDLTGGFINGL